MTTGRSTLVVTGSHLPQVPEHSEMIISSNCFTNLISLDDDLAELVISSLKTPVHLELTNHDEDERGVQETTFTTGEIVIESSPGL